ncbi:hypothetical protein FQA39_LY05350 [Lamprigera yunnana]|nr:hypothetical protein FQA39_LY05350 [Lamprigera yunnana]
MPLCEKEQTKLLRLHEVLEEIPSDPKSEDDEEDAATHDILGTYVLDVNNYLVPCTNDDNNVEFTTYDNLNSDQDIEFENSINIDKVDPPQDESDNDDDTPIAVRLYRQGVNWDSQYPHISKLDRYSKSRLHTMDKNLLYVGSSINIKRTDGQIHTAFVTGINYDLKSATVEWFENGETKGKEVDMPSVESLNPNTIIINPNDQQLYQPQMHKLEMNPIRTSVVSTLVNKPTNSSMIVSRMSTRHTVISHSNNEHITSVEAPNSK